MLLSLVDGVVYYKGQRMALEGHKRDDGRPHEGPVIYLGADIKEVTIQPAVGQHIRKTIRVPFPLYRVTKVGSAAEDARFFIRLLRALDEAASIQAQAERAW